MSDNIKKPQVFHCSKCVYPSSSATHLDFDEERVCTGCLTAEEKSEINWSERKELLLELLSEYKGVGHPQYDCIIPVSGGKDSYFQIHIAIEELGLNPLLVTYNGNNYSEVGLENLQNMREVFGVDHIFFTPAVRTLKVLNRLGMQVMGDMNWHNHVGIMTYPIRVAIEKKIPIMFWGEHGRADVAGMFSNYDFVEFTYRTRHEHDARGFEWYDMIEEAKKYDEQLSEKQLVPWMYPSDQKIQEVGVRGLYISNYFKWEANEHGSLVVEKYGFQPAKDEFERTYRKMSNLDDIHENGIHDYMKFIKFGYGRASDHVCKDIRAGIMTREQGLSEVKKRDHVKSQDLRRWLEYVGWTEEKFDYVADTFRDPRVWWIRNGEWVKQDPWGDESTYGKVHLSDHETAKYFVEN